MHFDDYKGETRASEFKVMKTIKERVEFVYELYGSNGQAEEEIRSNTTYYEIKDSIKPPRPFPKRKRIPKQRHEYK